MLNRNICNLIFDLNLSIPITVLEILEYACKNKNFPKVYKMPKQKYTFPQYEKALHTLLPSRKKKIIYVKLFSTNIYTLYTLGHHFRRKQQVTVCIW